MAFDYLEGLQLLTQVPRKFERFCHLALIDIG